MVFGKRSIKDGSVICILMTAYFAHSSLCQSLTPPDHLVPPPLPTPQRLTHSRTHGGTQPSAVGKPLGGGDQEQSGLMTRIARWFGFDSNDRPSEQLLTSEGQLNYQYSSPSGGQPYSYPKPNAHQNEKAPCNLCNKYPWVPMMPIRPPHLQSSYNQQALPAYDQQNLATRTAHSYVPNQSNLGFASNIEQTQQHLPAKQRAVNFQFPTHNSFRSTPPHHSFPPLIPVHVPNLSASAIPPLYSASPFNGLDASTAAVITEQQLPSTERAHFSENVGAHSELRPDSVIPSNAREKDPSYEIFKSHQITDFVASVEYPAKYVPSSNIDLGAAQPQQNTGQLPQVGENAVYQNRYIRPNLNSRIPASQILTDIGNFEVLRSSPPHQTSALTSVPRDQTTSAPATHYETQKGIVYDASGADNFPSASSHNLTEVAQKNSQEFWTVKSNDFYYTTLEPPNNLEISTQVSSHQETDVVTERLHETTIEFLPSLQTDITSFLRHNINSHPSRETPKRLLDAPIYHNKAISGSPRPFTRDPSELDFRLGATKLLAPAQQLNQKFNTEQFAATPPLGLAFSAADPTPTSTYSAIDASGHFAGMSAPPVPPPATKVHQVIIPYTTKNRPRPFQPTRTTDSVFAKWSNANNIELHEQQESKLVSTATEAPPNTRRTTKYLTKILASNLRDLLKQEHEKKSVESAPSFDLSLLQKNIDGWTEQEYTSLSHRASTPTIRGRSKHIPAEYLTTTPSPRQAKTTSAFDVSELPTSINNLESLLLRRAPKRWQYAPVDDNNLVDSDEATTVRAATTDAMTLATMPKISITPFYQRPMPFQEPEELWQKARVLISPQTKEKVYVVTPQPQYFPKHLPATSTEATVSKTRNIKSPRFLIRPTPGNGNGTSASKETSGLYSPELFGLMGLSAYIPAEPVEIIDGNSKVITIVTPSPTKEESGGPRPKTSNSSSKLKESQPKPTMSPSPR